MLGFKKKEKSSIIKEADEMTGVRMTVIPEIFYGGKDPVLHYEETAINVPSKPKTLPPPPKKLPPKPAASKPPFSIGKALMILLPVVVLAGGGLTWYLMVKSKQASIARTPTATPLPPAPIAPEPEPEPEPAPPPELAPSLPERPLVFPRIFLVDSADLDLDALTDKEEEMFTTDSGVWDSDQDGYFDGQEVFNLYNPKGFAPVRLIDSGLIREYVNPTWQYRVYYPIGWEAAPVDSKADHVLFSAITGDFIEVRAFAKESGEAFTDWFARRTADQQFSDLSDISNRFNVSGWKRRDELAAYFQTDQSVFVFIYQIGAAAEDVPFRNIMKMMYQSFRPGSGVTDEIPGQTPLPSAPDFTTLLPPGDLAPQNEPDDFFAVQNDSGASTSSVQ